MRDELSNGWRESGWQPVGRPAFFATLGCAILLLVFYKESRTDFLPIIDHVNLAFHEFGHLAFGLVGVWWIAYLGGTLGELIMPLLVMAAFWRKGHTASFAIAAIWFFQNFFYISTYMADARAQQLPLVGGGDHDWMNLFFHWNLLSQDTVIAGYMDAAGGLGIVLILAWLGRRAFLLDE